MTRADRFSAAVAVACFKFFAGAAWTLVVAANLRRLAPDRCGGSLPRGLLWNRSRAVIDHALIAELLNNAVPVNTATIIPIAGVIVSCPRL